MKTAEALLRVSLALEGVHEVGFSNRGPQVEEMQAADDLPGGGYAWCVSSLQFAADLVGVTLPSQTASVGFLEAAYRKAGYLVDEPVRGAQGFWRLDAGTWPDHLITVERVVATRGSWTVATIEGNTSKGFGSVDDGGGQYRRTRIIAKGMITWGLVPGDIAAELVSGTLAAIAQARREGKVVSVPLVERLRLRLPTRKPPEEALFWLWLRWHLGEGEFRPHGRRNLRYRPAVLPRSVPKAWWQRAREFTRRRRDT